MTSTDDATAERGQEGPRRLTGRVVLMLVAVLFAAVALALLVVAARSHGGTVHRLDIRVNDRINRYVHDHPDETTAWKVVTDVGGPTTWRVLAGVAALALWARRKVRLAVLIAVAMAGAALLSGVVKVAVDRARPLVPHPVDHAGGGSFPSGHALTSFTAAALLVLLVGPHLSRLGRAVLAAAAALVALAVALSRLMLGVHYVTDILGGWLIGALWLTAVFAVFRPWRERRPSDPRTRSRQSLTASAPDAGSGRS
jgi:undecaprenyl-diphosphatase